MSLSSPPKIVVSAQIEREQRLGLSRESLELVDRDGDLVFLDYVGQWDTLSHVRRRRYADGMQPLGLRPSRSCARRASRPDRLELEGLGSAVTRPPTRSRLGFDVSGIRPLVARTWETRVEARERVRARAELNPPRRTANGEPLLERPVGTGSRGSMTARDQSEAVGSPRTRSRCSPWMMRTLIPDAGYGLRGWAVLGSNQ